MPDLTALSAYDFDLPDDRIALRPASPRDSARLLAVRPGEGLEDRTVADLPGLLRPGDVLVFNDTRVIPARLRAVRPARAQGGGDGLPVPIEILLHQRLSSERWLAFARPAKRVRAGDRLAFGTAPDRACDLPRLDATVAERGGDGQVTLAFDLSGPALDDAIRAAGEMPLPPYIAAQRPEDERDRADYQTVYAREDGSVAAPTAGLHFTPGLIERLHQAGISTETVTLHVGAGTFLPVKTERLDDHRMHAEVGEVTAETAAALNAARARGGRIVCVGTTSLRLLESASGDDGLVRPWSGATDIFIRPGHRFRACDVLMTNFHLPKSTLFVLVSAFAGAETMRAAYGHAIAGGYRFYSYGDSSLLFPADASSDLLT